MRMRKKKHAEERIAACGELLVTEPQSFSGKWREAFAARLERCVDTAALSLEIGCGKGAFVLEMARREPETLFVAVECCREALLLAMEKVKDAGVPNILFLHENAADLDQIFAPEEVDRIYLNFSDPWPKARHAKRRLTAPSFLALYARILKQDGFLRQKTDNVILFESSLENYKALGWRLSDLTRDLHASPENADNIETEYEKNFSAKGFAIQAVTARKP